MKIHEYLYLMMLLHTLSREKAFDIFSEKKNYYSLVISITAAFKFAMLDCCK